jgi:hypothetical protein
MNEESPVPPPAALSETELRPDEVRALLAALTAKARIEQIRLRGPAGQRSEQALTLPDAERALFAGEASAVQILYRFAGAAFCDTLLRRGEHFRLVRAGLPG